MDYEQIIEKFYGEKFSTLYLIDSHFGTEIYGLFTGTGRYILKSFPPYMKSAKNEGSITDYLYNKCLNVARFLKTRDNLYYVEIDECIITIQEHIAGTTFQLNSAPDWFLDESARLLGKINSVLSSYEGLPLRFGQDFFRQIPHLKRENSTKRILCWQKLKVMKKQYCFTKSRLTIY